jgi:hypothetical protein
MCEDSCLLQAAVGFTQSFIAGFESITAVLLKIQVYWDMTLFLWGSSSRRFEVL